MTAEQLIAGLESLGSLPDMYMRLDEAINAPNSSFQYIGQLISEDAALSARLLRIANSSMYSFPTKIETIQRAMSVIGTKELREMVLATTVIDMFEDIELTELSMKSFWCHSIACGVAARVIATLRRESNVERFYVAGIMHDIGRLIMISELPDETNQILLQSQSDPRPLFAIEHEVLGFDHAELGGLLLQNWKLPETHQESVAYHHNPDAAHHYPIEASITHVADIIANAMQLGFSGTAYVYPLEQSAWRKLDLPESQLEVVVTHIEQQYKDAVRLFVADG